MSTEVTALVSHPTRLSPLKGFSSGCFSPPCPAPFLANQNHQLPVNGDAGVNEVSLEELVLLHRQRDDHRREFRSL
jgi:hypothetical protein